MTTVKKLIQKTRARLPAKHGLVLDFPDARVRLLCNAPDLVAELDAYFGRFVSEGPGQDILITAHQGPAPAGELTFAEKQPDPGKSKIKEEYADLLDGRVVRKKLTGMVFAFGGGLHLAAGPCLENPNQVVNFINNRYMGIMISRGCLLGHASAVAHNGRGLAVAGFSGAGKSTLALKMMSEGAMFVSNDRLLLKRAGADALMWGVAKLPRINPGTALNNPDLAFVIPADERTRFAALPPDELWKLEHKYDVFIDRCFGPGRFSLASGMAGLFVLNWKRDGGLCRARAVDIAERRDLLPAIMKSEGLFFLNNGLTDPRIRSEDDYLEVLSGLQVVELTGGVDFDKAAKLGMKFLETGRIDEF